MLKAGKLILADPILSLFNSVLENSIYPKSWSLDILTPLHKKNEKSDPNNFRGIVVSSCLGKLFTGCPKKNKTGFLLNISATNDRIFKSFFSPEN